MRLLVVYDTGLYGAHLVAEAAIQRGHSADICSIRDLVIRIGGRTEVILWAQNAARLYDMILFKSVGRHLDHASILARQLLEEGTAVIDKNLIEGRQDKLHSAWVLSNSGLPCLKTYGLLSLEVAHSILESLKFPVVVKGKSAAQGREVYKFNTPDEAIQFLANSGVDRYLVQEYARAPYDYRVFVIGNQALGAVAKIPPVGDFRTNRALGGAFIPADISDEIARLAEEAAQVTNTEIAGVDIIYCDDNPYILEVQSRPGFVGFMEATGINVPLKIVEYIEKRIGVQGE